MISSNHALPASLRKPADALGLSVPHGRHATPYLVTNPESRVEFRDVKSASAFQGRYTRLPQEPEDARITGVTRSLNRRLLGLNLGGSLHRSPEALIA